jgi:hypothetical protein
MHWRTDANKKIFRFDAVASGGVDPGDGSHQTNFVLSGVNNVFKSRQHDETKTGLLFDAADIELNTDTGVSINGNFTFPQVDGTVDQVMSTDGTGTLSWVDGGGGGATALSDLSDVAELNLQNNDLLMYNSTGAEWQNTNLGISIAPTVTLAAIVYTGYKGSATITNYASYDSPNIWAQLVDQYGVVIKPLSSMIIDEVNGTVKWLADNPVGTGYKLQTRIQDFGDLASEITENVFDQEDIVVNATFRYFRMGNFTGQSDQPGNRVMVTDFSLFTGTGGTGTKYPTNMTSNTTPSPYVATSTRIFSNTYNVWKAFDANITGTFWWNLGSGSIAALSDSITIDMGSSVQIQSLRIVTTGNTTYQWSGCKIWGSDTGAFTGEETLVVDTTGSIVSPPAINLIG